MKAWRKILFELQEGIRISGGALWSNKLRSGLTMLGIIIGILTVTLMGTAFEGINRAFYKSISGLSTDLLIVERFPWFNEDPWWKIKDRPSVTLQEARSIERRFPYAIAVATAAETSRPTRRGAISAGGVRVVGNSAEGALVRGVGLQEGRFFTAAEVAGARPVCVLGAELAEQFFGTESPLGERIRIAESAYEVVGVLERMGQFLFGFNQDNQVVVPITRYMADFARNADVSILVKVADMARLPEAEEELRGLMRTVRGLGPTDPDNFAINKHDAFVRTFNRMGGTIAAVGFFITGLALVVGGIGIMNIMFVSVTERTREIGIRKALGAKRRAIVLQFLTEAVIICAVGGVVAIGMAWPITLALQKAMPAVMSWKVIAVALLVAAVTGIAAGFFPAWRAARMHPVDALRNE